MNPCNIACINIVTVRNSNIGIVKFQKEIVSLLEIAVKYYYNLRSKVRNELRIHQKDKMPQTIKKLTKALEKKMR